MADNLPLLPGKKESVCGDVKPVLREVFQEMDHLPPLALESTSATDEEKLWIKKYNSECEEIWHQEGDLREQFAKRVSKKPLRNLYSLSEPTRDRGKEWRGKEMIGRRDLMPSIEQNAAGDRTLWVQNVLNKSSCNISYEEKPCEKLHQPLSTIALDVCSRQTYSIGELVVRRPLSSAQEIPPPPLPDYVCCQPHEIKFKNFAVGDTLIQEVRLYNVSKFEIRLSIKLPRRRELGVELGSSSGLRVTSGSYNTLKVTFRPTDTRTIHDELVVRTSIVYVHQIDSPLVTYSDSLSDTAAKKADIIDLGAKLLGDEHHAVLVFQCASTHAQFFILTEDAWIDWTVEELTSVGSIKTGSFTVHPAWWLGGGIVHGSARCRATDAGFQKSCLRILSSTAVTRVLHVIADSMHYSPKHIKVQAHEKNYDIDSDDDPDCENYVHLGTAFPNRSLSAYVYIMNFSPMPYSFYWQFRPWGVCTCWQEYMASPSLMEEEDRLSELLCPGAKEAKEGRGDQNEDSEENYRRVRVEPERGVVRERASCVVNVVVPEVGTCVGIHRAVMLLILKDIPVESFKPKFAPNILRTRTVEEFGPGGKSWKRKVCDIIHSQMEVWWNVVPIQFVLDPPVVPLTYSRRVKSLRIPFSATLLYGRDNVRTRWESTTPMVLPAGPILSPLHSVPAKLPLKLPALPNIYPEMDVITLSTQTNEWSARCYVTRACATRHPSLAPSGHWLGVVTPGAKVFADIVISNHTHQHICWWATAYRWAGENMPSKPCCSTTASTWCGTCHETNCTCSMLHPSRGALAHEKRKTVRYNVYAPTSDRGVATLVQVTRTEPDTAKIPGTAGSNSRASLVMYRVLAPRLLIRVFECGGDKRDESVPCEYDMTGQNCSLDPGEMKLPKGCPVLRPSRALSPCNWTCYKLRITNITPMATTVKWEAPVDGEEFLKVKFLPKEFDIGGHAEIITTVILEPQKVCGRRLFVLRAQVKHAYKPLYLIIDTAIDGVKVIFEVPLGGMERNDSFVALRGSQKEIYPWDDKPKPSTPMEWFLEEDDRRAALKDHICNCHYDYVPPIKPVRPPKGEDETPSLPEILTSPPSLVCGCYSKAKPIVPDYDEPCCLQFRDVPLRTVRSRRLTLRNVGQMTAKWRLVVRRWPRQRNQDANIEALIAGKDRWAGDVQAPGVAIECSPARGVCVARQNVDILVHMYADTWGVYYDQIMLMVDNVDPIVIDVWIEVVGSPLQFSRILSEEKVKRDFDSTMWLSTSDPVRTLRVKNSSRSQLTIHAYTLLEHEHSQDEWPFRFYVRFIDLLPPVCPCSTYVSSDNILASMSSKGTQNSSIPEEMDTDIELFFAADYGLQDNEYYTVEPQVCTVPAGAWMEWRVTLKPRPGGEPTPPGLVLLRTIPEDNKGDFWHRCEPLPGLVGVRTAPRASALRLSCSEVRAKLCALELRYNEVSRVRKRFRMRNIGIAPLLVHCTTAQPWQIVTDKPKNDCGHCGCQHETGERHDEVEMLLEPWSSAAMCVEVAVETTEMWPEVAKEGDVSEKCVQSGYPPKREVTGELAFYSEQGHLETIPLILEVDFPQLSLEPELIDFGFVTDGDTRKTYFTVWHSSLSATIDLGVTWQGNAKLRLYPRHLRVSPGERARIYLQYTAKWTGAPVPVEGCLRVWAAAGAGAWCRGALYVRAQPARDAKFLREGHDHTDQWNLWPPSLPRL